MSATGAMWIAIAATLLGSLFAAISMSLASVTRAAVETLLAQRGTSATPARLVRILDGLGVGSWFADIFVSSRIGYAKPDRQIFDAALGRHGLAAEKAIHVGDSETNDLLGAQNAGLKALLIDRGRQTDETAPERIASLQEIVTHLD